MYRKLSWFEYFDLLLKPISPGRTISIITMSTDPQSTNDFGPFVPRMGCECPISGKRVEYNSVRDLEAALNYHGKEVCGFLVEPIQGEAGIFVPDDGIHYFLYDPFLIINSNIHS